jgi:hypothetical protein
VLAAARPAVTRQVRVRAPQASLERDSGVSGSMPGSYPGCEGSSPSSLTGRRRTHGVAAATLPCQGGRAGSTPAGCSEATPPNQADPSRPCGTAAQFATLSQWRSRVRIPSGALPSSEFRVPSSESAGLARNSELGTRNYVGDVAQPGRGSGFRSRPVWVRLPPSPLAGGRVLSGVS